jgi:hypothetical protein
MSIEKLPIDSPTIMDFAAGGAKNIKTILKQLESDGTIGISVDCVIFGFDDNELRRILVRAGAIRFESKSGYEMWALMTRVPSDWLERGLTKLEQDPARGSRYSYN